MYLSLALIAALIWFLWLFFDHRVFLSRELGRFDSAPLDLYDLIKTKFNQTLASFGKSKKARKLTKSQLELEQKLREAGLESASDRGKYFLIRSISIIAGPTLGSLAYFKLSTYYGTVVLLLSTIISLLIPIFWLRAKISSRNEDIQRELPLLIDLTNLGTSAGWDIAASLERVVDALYLEFPHHPLIREFKRAVWSTSSGYTWNEALDRISEKLDNHAVRRSALALGQAIKQGGDRTSQLEGIAMDAQRVYYADLDNRLAALPVKAVLITMLLMISYFMIILTPAGVQIKNIIFK